MSVYNSKKGAKKFVFTHDRKNMLQEIPYTDTINTNKELALFRESIRGPKSQVYCKFRSLILAQDGYPKGCNVRGDVIFDRMIDSFVSINLTATMYSLNGEELDNDCIYWKVSDKTRSSNFFHVNTLQTVSLQKKSGMTFGFVFPKPVEAIFSIRFTITFGVDNIQNYSIRPFYLKASYFRKNKEKNTITKEINLITDDRIWLPKLLKASETTPFNVDVDDQDFDFNDLFDNDLHGYDLSEIPPLHCYEILKDNV